MSTDNTPLAYFKFNSCVKHCSIIIPDYSDTLQQNPFPRTGLVSLAGAFAAPCSIMNSHEPTKNLRGENVPLSLEKLKPRPQNRLLVPLWGSFFMGVPLGIHEDWCISWGCTPRKVVRRYLASFLKPSRYFRPKFRINYSRPFHEFDAILLWGGNAGKMYGKIAQCTVS